MATIDKRAEQSCYLMKLPVELRLMITEVGFQDTVDTFTPVPGRKTIEFVGVIALLHTSKTLRAESIERLVALGFEGARVARVHFNQLPARIAERGIAGLEERVRRHAAQVEAYYQMDVMDALRSLLYDVEIGHRCIIKMREEENARRSLDEARNPAGDARRLLRQDG